MELSCNSSVSFDSDTSQNTILKPSLSDNLIILQTPVHKQLKVRFQTPARTPLATLQSVNLACATSIHTEVSQAVDEQDDKSWKERIEVVTKYDHEEYVNSAQQFIEEIIAKVVEQCRRKESSINPSDTPIPLQSMLKEEAETAIADEDSLQNLSDFEDKENIFMDQACCLGGGKRNDKSSSSSAEEMKRPAPQSDTLQSFETKILSDENLPPDINERCKPRDDDIDTNNMAFSPSRLSTIYSIFDTEQLPANLQLECAHAAEFCSKKSHPNPKKDKMSILKALSSNKGSLYCTRKVIAARNPSPPNSPLPLVAETAHFSSPVRNEQRSELVVGDEEFQDAATLIKRGFDFDLDFLETKGNEKSTSDLRKQSLYLKFDPLVAGENPEQHRALIGRKSDIIDLTGHASLPRATQASIKKSPVRSKPDLLCASPSTYVRVSTSPRSGKKDAWMPAQCQAGDGDEIVELLKYSEADMENMKEPLLRQIDSLNATITSQKQRIDQMQIVLEEFEGTVFEMAQKYDEQKSKVEMEKSEIEMEQRKTIAHLESVEKAYLELLQRSEQMKTGISNYKVNEETYKKVISEYQGAQESSQQRYKALKATMEEAHAKLKLETEAEKKDMRSQLSAAKARCKCLENQAKSLQLQLDQKTNENDELTKICDELIEQQQTVS